MSTATARNGVDAWVDSLRPSLNTGGGKWLRIQTPGTATKYGYIHFKNPVPRGGTVLSATLSFYGSGASGASFTATLQRISAKWAESLIDYNSRPGVTGTTVSLTQTQSVDGLEWAFDVTAQLQTITDGAANYGWRISTTDTTERKFYSLNASDFRPVLVVEWSDAPDAPTELSPSGGSAVSVAKPVLTFNFHDVSGSVRMAACQVHIKATNSGWTAAGGFAAPDFDSGTVTTSDPELDLSTTAFTGITAGTTKYWTVRVQDAAGLWSDYSTVRHFTRVTRGTLTINSPTGGVVNDATQAVLWTLTGATQIGWRLMLADDADPTNLVYDTGRRSGTATSHTIPKGIITDETTTYRLTLRVWDEPLRVQTPGDPVHTEAVETFIFTETTPTAVLTLTAAQVASGQPHVALTFTRATAPDSFSIWRGGKVVDTDLDPADLLVSGTTYQFIDRTAAPHTTHTWKVRCKTNGTGLGPARSVSLSYEVTEIWLADYTNPGSNRLVPIVVTSEFQPSFTMPEIGAVYTPVDGRKVVGVTHAQRGLEGHIEGLIIDRAGLTADNTVADFLWMKDRPTNQLRLTIGEQNLRVIIKNAEAVPVIGYGTGARIARFDFYSLDGVTQR